MPGEKFPERNCFTIKEETNEQLNYIEEIEQLEYNIENIPDYEKAYIPYENVTFNIDSFQFILNFLTIQFVKLKIIEQIAFKSCITLIKL